MTILTGLSRRLVEQGVIQENQIEEIQSIAKSENKSFVSIAVSTKSASAKGIAIVASEEFGLSLIHI